MNNNIEDGFVLRSTREDDDHPVLCGVQATGRLDGVLFELTLRQTYRNAGARNLEVIYTFPLPHRAVLMGMAAELGGKRLEGTVLAREQAEAQYEEALAEGDSPVLLESLGGGLHTANIGNLKPGDEVVLEVRFAQLLNFEQGRLRIAVPMTIAPRFGSASQGGLLPHQVPPTTMDAEYTLGLEVLIAGALASGRVECATHRFVNEQVEGGLRLNLAPGATLDRDVVLLLTPLERQPSLLLWGQDRVSGSAPGVAVAAFEVPRSAERPRIALKILVDCSGSMNGDSIDSARSALQAVLGGLRPGDVVSLSRFGSEVEHEVEPVSLNAGALQRLGTALEALAADMGGTEMRGALTSVFALKSPKGPANADGSDVLLITDGEVWDAGVLVRAARSSGHRVFAIGVGSAPAEGALREVAESSGGSCEFATPGESLHEAARRTMDRIRQQRWSDARVVWAGSPIWQVPLPKSLFGGDTVLAMAGFAGRQPQMQPQVQPVRLLARPETLGADGAGQEGNRLDEIELARTEADAPCPGDTLARMAAARRLVDADEPAARQMALAHQLIGPHTHCVLVHRRAEADKPTEEAELHRVSTMLAAGWGGMGQVTDPAPKLHMKFGIDRGSSLSVPSVWRSGRPQSAPSSGAELRMSEELDIPEFLRQQADESPSKKSLRSRPARPSSSAAPSSSASSLASSQPATLRQIMTAVAEHFVHGGLPGGLAARCASFEGIGPVADALREAGGQPARESQWWLLLAMWVASRPGTDGDEICEILLERYTRTIDPDLRRRAWAVFDQWLGSYPSSSWQKPRIERLAQALRRSMRGG